MTDEPIVITITRENVRAVLQAALVNREPTEEEVSSFFLFVTNHLDDCLQTQAQMFLRIDASNGYA